MAGAAAVGGTRRTRPRHPARRSGSTRRSGCSPPGPRRRIPDSPSARPTRGAWRRSAARWMACRWRSSWRLPGSGRCRWSRSRRALTTGSGCSPRGDRTAPPRQRTLRATIDWSHELLTASEQVLLRRLSVFSGWSLEMAEQVCADDDIPAADILDLLAALVDKSLVGGRARGARPGPLPAARHHPRLRGGAAGRCGRDRGDPAPGSAITRCGWRSTTWRSGWP